MFNFWNPAESGLSLVNWANPLSNHDFNRDLDGLWIAGGIGFGSGTFYDLSKSQTNGTLTNMDPATDWNGLGLDFASGTGTPQYVSFSGIGEDFSSDFTNPYTAFIAFYPTASLSQSNGIFGNSISGTGGNIGFSIQTSFSSPYNRLRIVAGNNQQVYLGTTLTAGELYIAHLTHDGAGNWVAYVNGSQVGTATGTASTRGGGLRLGDTTNTSDSANVRVSSCGVWLGREFSANEVLGHYLEVLHGFPRTLNRISVPLGKPPAASSVLPALDEGMLVGGLQSLSGGLC